MTLRERIEKHIRESGGNPKNVHDCMNFFMEAFTQQNGYIEFQHDVAIAFSMSGIDIEIDYAEAFLNDIERRKTDAS